MGKLQKTVQEMQDFLVQNNDLEGIHGDGKSIAVVPDIPITNYFADGIYLRQMEMPADTVVVGAIHNHLHAWFLLTGRVLINNNGEIIEHIAPCFTISKPGSKRLIYALEDSIFVNVHKNPSNTQDLKELEKEIVSMTMDEFNKKYK
jgi:hypothetical protein